MNYLTQTKLTPAPKPTAWELDSLAIQRAAKREKKLIFLSRPSGEGADTWDPRAASALIEDKGYVYDEATGGFVAPKGKKLGAVKAKAAALVNSDRGWNRDSPATLADKSCRSVGCIGATTRTMEPQHAGPWLRKAALDFARCQRATPGSTSARRLAEQAIVQYENGTYDRNAVLRVRALVWLLADKGLVGSLAAKGAGELIEKHLNLA